MSDQEGKQEPVATIKEAFVLYGDRLHGFIYGDRSTEGNHPFADGEEVTTSKVLRIEGDRVWTRNSLYAVEWIDGAKPSQWPPYEAPQ